MKKYRVDLGYGENVQSVPEYQTVDTVEAENAEEAAKIIFNGLDPMDVNDAIFQVWDDEYGKLIDYFWF